MGSVSCKYRLLTSIIFIHDCTLFIWECDSLISLLDVLVLYLSTLCVCGWSRNHKVVGSNPRLPWLHVEVFSSKLLNAKPLLMMMMMMMMMEKFSRNPGPFDALVPWAACTLEQCIMNVSHLSCWWSVLEQGERRITWSLQHATLFWWSWVLFEVVST